MSLLSLARAASLLSLQTLLSLSFSMGTVLIIAAWRALTSSLSTSLSCLRRTVSPCKTSNTKPTSSQWGWALGPPKHWRWSPRICRSSSGYPQRWGEWSPWAPWRRTSSPSHPSSPRPGLGGTRSRPLWVSSTHWVTNTASWLVGTGHITRAPDWLLLYLLRTKPGSSRERETGPWPTSCMRLLVPALTSSLVQGAGTSSTMGVW